MPRHNTIDRMLRKNVALTPGCWVWHGSMHTNGYGKTTLLWRTRLAHRVFYEHFIGPIPEGYQVDHLCKNRACVNPHHLEAVAPIVNNARSDSPSAHNKRKTECIRGHELSGANLYMTPDGRRQCKICRNFSGTKALTEKCFA